MNPSNTVTLTGNLAADPVLFTNADGSHTAKFTVITRAAGDAKRTVGVKGFVPADRDADKSVYAYMFKGDAVAVIAELDTNSWVDKSTGEPRYELVCQARGIDLLTSPAERADRQKRRAARELASA